MRKLLIALVLLPLAAMGFCSLPLTSVAILTVTVMDLDRNPITEGATAIYLDAAGQAIVTISSGDPQSWSNNLHWWAHSLYDTSLLRPSDAMRAVAVVVAAPGCASLRVPVALARSYEPLDFTPHGGGPAYFIYRFDTVVALACG